MATINISRPPTLCETRSQLATALGDLQQLTRLQSDFQD